MKYLFLLLVSFSAFASEDTFITTTIASYHSDRSIEHNESNPGLGIKHDQWVAGFYENSHFEQSEYVGYEFKKQVYPWLAGALQTGLLTGYEKSNLHTPSINGVRIYALPTLIFGRDIQYKLGVVPIDKWTLTFQIDWKI